MPQTDEMLERQGHIDVYEQLMLTDVVECEVSVDFVGGRSAVAKSGVAVVPRVGRNTYDSTVRKSLRHWNTD